MVDSNNKALKLPRPGRTTMEAPPVAADSVIAASQAELINRLHETLDFNHLIDAFIKEVRCVLPCDGIEFQEDGIGLYFIDGLLSTHRCQYDIHYGDMQLGNICFTREMPFDEAEISQIEVYVAGLTLPLRNAVLHQEAIRYAQRDDLTGLRNGSYYHDNVELEIKRAHRYKTPFSLLVINLDNFSLINKAFGHEAGDNVLIEVAGRLESASRSSDIVYRKSGNEFMVFLPNTSKPDAIRVANRVKDEVMAVPCEFDDFNICFTLSMAVVTVAQNDTAYDLIERAENTLFHAKILGKNRIEVELSPEPLTAELM